MTVDKIIGRIDPLFGAVLIFMAVGTIGMLLIEGYELYPVKSLQNLNPQELPLWPLMFLPIACGAISGFHATQSPSPSSRRRGVWSVLRWSDGWHPCGVHFLLTLKKKQSGWPVEDRPRRRPCRTTAPALFEWKDDAP